MSKGGPLELWGLWKIGVQHEVSFLLHCFMGLATVTDKNKIMPMLYMAYESHSIL